MNRGWLKEMNVEAQDRRKRQRGDDVLTHIEDVTYAVLRSRSENGSAPDTSYQLSTATN